MPDAAASTGDRANMVDHLQSSGDCLDAVTAGCAVAVFVGGSCVACVRGKKTRENATKRAFSRWTDFKRTYRRTARAIVAALALFQGALFFLDIYTDLDLTVEVNKTGEHPWWTGFLATFLVLGYAMGWAYLVYFAAVTAEDGRKGRDVTLALLLGPPALVLLDVAYLLTAFPGLEERMLAHPSLPDRARLLMVTYKSLRPLTESFFESVPQLVLQPVALG